MRDVLPVIMRLPQESPPDKCNSEHDCQRGVLTDGRGEQRGRCGGGDSELTNKHEKKNAAVQCGLRGCCLGETAWALIRGALLTEPISLCWSVDWMQCGFSIIVPVVGVNSRYRVCDLYCCQLKRYSANLVWSFYEVLSAIGSFRRSYRYARTYKLSRHFQ